MFKVTISDAQPSSVKMSRKNVAHITITNDKEMHEELDANDKMIEFYL